MASTDPVINAIYATLQKVSNNVQRNVSQTLFNLGVRDYIRLVIVIGGYCLLRPYLLKLGARFQAKDHEREVDADELSSPAAISANSLRGQVQVPEDSDDDDDDGEGESTSVQWGRSARQRQRQMLRNILEAEERMKVEEAEAEEDKDIEEFLT